MAKYYVNVERIGTFQYKDPEMQIQHCEHGPAIEYAGGDKYWYKHDMRHRDDGPAIELANGTKLWWINGKCHREDGPAVEYADGKVEYWLKGKFYFTKEEWEAAIRPVEEMTVAQIEQQLGKRIKIIK